MKIAVGSDHAGFAAKEITLKTLKTLGHEAADFGTSGCDSVDYPDYAAAVCNAVASGAAERGILLCGSGVGMCIAANKYKGIRASIAHDIYSAAQGVQHNDMNVLCIGGKVVDHAALPRIIEAFINARFLKDEERFARRVQKLLAIEAANFK
ncbi:MAG: ribose 5-phosphate isomerase B [Elusimicrobiota bacterium]|jgi:ribose 5-phosphate isomerase B|nr:ribose 5-phosphate isomerase B [Elusimicrobiota bacterium]